MINQVEHRLYENMGNKPCKQHTSRWVGNKMFSNLGYWCLQKYKTLSSSCILKNYLNGGGQLHTRSCLLNGFFCKENVARAEIMLLHASYNMHSTVVFANRFMINAERQYEVWCLPCQNCKRLGLLGVCVQTGKVTGFLLEHRWLLTISIIIHARVMCLWATEDSFNKAI